jgi:hypothetical protein
MEEGQRIAPAQTQQPAQTAAPSQARGGGATTSTGPGATVPDPIDFFAENASGVGVPRGRTQIDNSKALTWMPILRRLAAGPGASPMLANAIINQARELSRARHVPATVVDMDATDDALEAMLDEGI